MHHRTVEELMSRDVVRARRDTPFKELVRLLEENGVTAVPVVDELDRPLGVPATRRCRSSRATGSPNWSRSA
ncbi:CBS domain-containing protein, partial [Streptomyces olivaceoviridis]